jgi:hypothetical protein
LGNSTCWDFTYFTKKTVVFPLCGYCPFLLWAHGCSHAGCRRCSC